MERHMKHERDWHGRSFIDYLAIRRFCMEWYNITLGSIDLVRVRDYLFGKEHFPTYQMAVNEALFEYLTSLGRDVKKHVVNGSYVPAPFIPVPEGEDKPLLDVTVQTPDGWQLNTYNNSWTWSQQAYDACMANSGFINHHGEVVNNEQPAVTPTEQTREEKITHFIKNNLQN